MVMDFENKKVNGKNDIKTGNLFKLHGMDDYYLEVMFRYKGLSSWNGCVPIRAKYQGININENKIDIFDWVERCYDILDPRNSDAWNREQNRYWDDGNSMDTRAVFDALNGNRKITSWICRKCGDVQAVNPQCGARIKNLKERGYSIATRKIMCPNCGSKQFHDILIRLERNSANVNVRNTISASLRHRIKTVLPLKDACFDSPQKKSELVIDHKFPSTRWVNGESLNENDMTDEEIKQKFQLLTNQTNLQKERYCKKCMSEGVRGDFFGIKWYYEGDETWQGVNNADENGCIGCPWYDLEEWKKRFNERLIDVYNEENLL